MHSKFREHAPGFIAPITEDCMNATCTGRRCEHESHVSNLERRGLRGVRLRRTSSSASSSARRALFQFSRAASRVVPNRIHATCSISQRSPALAEEAWCTTHPLDLERCSQATLFYTIASVFSLVHATTAGCCIQCGTIPETMVQPAVVKDEGPEIT